MTYYQLASICNSLGTDSINVKFSDEDESNFLSRSLSKYTSRVKQRINN